MLSDIAKQLSGLLSAVEQESVVLKKALADADRVKEANAKEKAILEDKEVNLSKRESTVANIEDVVSLKGKVSAEQSKLNEGIAQFKKEVESFSAYRASEVVELKTKAERVLSKEVKLDKGLAKLEEDSRTYKDKVLAQLRKAG